MGLDVSFGAADGRRRDRRLRAWYTASALAGVASLWCAAPVAARNLSADILPPALAKITPSIVSDELTQQSAIGVASTALTDFSHITPPPAVNTGTAWRIVKEVWDETDEAGYSAFVQAIGRSECRSLGDCLRSDANPYRETDKRFFYGDCADMAYMLRAYYAWKNGLPFSYQSAMATADGKPDDLRYSTGGNRVTSRRSAIGSKPISAPGFITRIGGEVSTAMFRTHPETGGGRLFDDFYPVKISRETIRPGAIAYDIYGHVGIVYDILDDGRILVVASHPDHAVTRSVYGPNFMRSRPDLGAGLKAWRPIRLDGATQHSDGVFVGGKIVAAGNEEIPTYSLEQFFGNVPHPSGEWQYGEFRFQDRTLGYYDFVRRSLASPGFAYNPVNELRFGLRTLCGDIKARKIAVDRAVASGIHRQSHPARLPVNIYGTYGLWEEHSTPSRDARLKVSFIELRRVIEKLFVRAQLKDPSVVYGGDNLPRDLLDAYENEVRQCSIAYRRSDNSRVRINLDHVMGRLFDLSFDPYHCPERRWGARGAELDTCSDGAVKEQWYNAQRFLRYQAERTYDVRMNFSLAELKAPMLAAPEDGGIGVDAPADHDIRAYLEELVAPEVLTSSYSDEELRLMDTSF